MKSFVIFNSVMLIGLTYTAADFGCPGEWKFCDQHCRKYNFMWGNCDENDSICRCYGPREKPHLGCPDVWMYCHVTCKKFGYDHGVCTKQGQCVCKSRTPASADDRDVAASP